MAGYIGSRASVVSSGAERKKTFDITGTTTVLTGLSYTPTFVHLFHNGVRLVDGTDYTATDSTSITLTTAAENGDQVVVVSFATFQAADAYTKAEADAGFVSDPNGAVTVDGSGALLVGTASTIASADFTVNSATSTRMNLASDGVERFGVFADNGIAALYAGGTNVMTFSTNDTEHMRIDTAGRVTMPYQPAFNAYLISSPTSNGYYSYGTFVVNTVSIINNGEPAELILRHTKVNTGSHYNTSTGRFTAPVAGTYHFGFSFVYEPASTVSSFAEFLINGAGTDAHEMHTQSLTEYQQVTGTAVLPLNAGDYVSMSFKGGMHQRYTSFNGHLIG